MASTFKNQGAALGVTDTGSFYTAPSGTYAVIHALYISNHETSEAIAKKEDYDELPKCCQYERKE